MIPYDMIYDNLSPAQKALCTRNGITEEELETLARENGWNELEVADRLSALKDGLIAGDPEKLEYPVNTSGRVSAARMFATMYGRGDVLANIRKLKAAGLI